MITWAAAKKAFEDKNMVKFGSGKELNGWIDHDGKKFTRITVSKSNKDIPKGTLCSMARRIGVSATQLTEYVQCKIKGNELIEIIQNRKLKS